MISAIVCTYNRCESLRDTLHALQEQVIRPGLTLELVVVDNNSSDDTNAVVQKSARISRHPLRYVFESTQGQSQARNRGIQEARGDYLLFTDDDVIPDPHWVQAILNAFLEHGADGVGGAIHPLWLTQPPAWMAQQELRQTLWPLLALLDRGPEVMHASDTDGYFLYGANMAFRKQVFEDVGLFRTDLGRVGSNLVSGDETELLQRLFASKKRVIYTPHAVVLHKIPADRTRMSFFRRRKFDGSRSIVRMSARPQEHLARWLVRECASHGLSALWAYTRGAREQGIQRELLFWAQLGQLIGALEMRRYNAVEPRRREGQTSTTTPASSNGYGHARKRTWTIAWCHSGGAGGAQRATHAMARELAKRGHLIDEFLICDEPVQGFLSLAPFMRRTQRTTLGKVQSKALRPYLLETYGNYAQAMVKERQHERVWMETAARIDSGDYDFVHIDQFPSCASTGVLPYLKKATVVYGHGATGHRYGSGPETNSANAASALRVWYTRVCELPTQRLMRRRQMRERQQIHAARRVLTNSRYSVEVLARAYGCSASVCYYGVDQDMFRPLSLSIESMILSVGRLIPSKQHHLAIEAVGRIDRAHRPRVVIATPETSVRPSSPGAKTRAFLLEAARQHNVQLDLRCGPTQEELVRLYNQALAVVFAPIMEPFGLVTIEAMACGTPVIGVNEAGVQESIIDGVTGILVDRDVDQIARAIQRFQEHPTLRAEISRRALKYVREYWTWQRTIDRYEAEVETLLSARTHSEGAYP